MRVLPSLAAALCLLSFPGAALRAQNNVPQQGAEPRPQDTRPPSTTPTEPGTRSTQLAPASASPPPVQQPDVRLDSKPHTDIDTSVDSSPEPSDLGVDVALGADINVDLGHDIVATTPPGMLFRSVPDNPRMVYFSLPVRSIDQIAPADAATIAARREDLNHAARAGGFHLEQAGWSYRQAVCPATEPGRELGQSRPGSAGSESLNSDPGSILLQFERQEGTRTSAFTAVVPRAAALPVRAIPIVRNATPRKKHPVVEPLSKKLPRAAVAEALPPPTLRATLQPEQGWIATSDCIAELGGATPDIPNETFLSEDILTAPVPELKLLVNSEREVTFTDRIDQDHYVVWDERVSRKGSLQKIKHTEVRIVPRPVTNPPVPAPRLIANIPQPPIRMTPPPPSPLSGDKQ